MRKQPQRTLLILIVLNVVSLSVLGFYRTSDAAPRQAPQQVANPTEQMFEVINELKQLNVLMKEQNELLRTGKARVVISGVETPKS